MYGGRGIKKTRPLQERGESYKETRYHPDSPRCTRAMRPFAPDSGGLPSAPKAGWVSARKLGSELRRAPAMRAFSR